MPRYRRLTLTGLKRLRTTSESTRSLDLPVASFGVPLILKVWRWSSEPTASVRPLD
jgi:hypothetical protein